VVLQRELVISASATEIPWFGPFVSWFHVETRYAEALPNFFVHFGGLGDFFLLRFCEPRLDLAAASRYRWGLSTFLGYIAVS
jgi:hypothetical protein